MPGTKPQRSRNPFRRPAAFILLALCLLLTANRAAAKPKAAPAAGPDLQALFLSDIHFEPFYDPAKVPDLAAAPVSEWKKILSSPASADREQRFAALQQTCHARGDDTPFALLDSSLQAVHKTAALARFVTVSGDIISHSFQCKYKTTFPQANPADFSAFVEKTISFVTDQLAAALPGVRLYIALGNNDSDCGDYKLDPNSAFLAALGQQIATTFPPSERKAAAETYAAGGYFNLPLPMPNARMIVLDDLLMGAKSTTCGGKPPAEAVDAQIAWLTQQLADARSNKQKVWVMAHIPPGVDVHSTATHMDEVCTGKGPKMFLANEKIADALAQYSDVVQLAIFAHTHMDELRILKPENAASSVASPGIPVKLVSSISPINGNAPSFTLARVDPATAALKDFAVYASSNQTGIDATWPEEYDWDKTYHQPDFSAASVSSVVAAFQADPSAKTDSSQAYITNFFVGKSPLLGVVWPQYVCSLGSYSASGFKACICPADK